MEHIKKIHNAIFVSNRIVTYKAAAAILEINVNEAKKVLEKYVSDLSSKDETLNVSYVIGGITVKNENKVRIVPLNKYEKDKSCFKTITIDHIYSLQKSSLVDWTPIFNVDDLLYDKNDPTAVTVKEDVVNTKKQVKASEPVSKKRGISNFFNNANNHKKISTNQKSSTVAVKQETANGCKEQEKTTAFTNFFSKTNNKNISTVKKEQVNSDDEDKIVKVNKKRSRVINDDDVEDINATKCPKVDILDGNMEEEQQEQEYHSDEDIFESPEKNEKLMKDTEKSIEKDTQSSFSENITNSIENNSESTETTENSETLYEDNDRYSVTEKKKQGPKPTKTKQTKKNGTEKKKVDKREKKSKKEVVPKNKNNSNQKSILSFFQKK